MSVKRVYLIRHGETEGNLGKYFQSLDTKLSDNGHKGGKAVAQRFANIEVEKLFASHFTRAQQTAHYISEAVDIPVTTVESFHEVVRPAFIRGVAHHSEVGIQHRESYTKDFLNGDWNEDGAENYFDVIRRVEKCVSLLEGCTEKSIVVVSHGDMIRLLTAYLLLGKSPEIPTATMTVMKNLHKLSNTGITELVYKNNKWKLFMWNDHAHFAE